ncbi:MAG: phospho-N-acetylmuramoyl-pentapeptide-transferase [Coriobacteriia bacterium]|nr:phospho-N-acetylmuramoyl-pentapeptide-transferase [Coriobacteriia bacterium]
MIGFPQYPTFQVFLAIFMAIAITMLLLPAWIKLLRYRQIGQQIRADGPQRHLVKQGTPTMGGVVILFAILVTVVLLTRTSSEAEFTRVMLIAFATLTCGLVGFIDDAAKLVKERSLGLRPNAKMILLTIISVAFTLVAVNYGNISPVVSIPLLASIDLGVLSTTINVFGTAFYIPWLYLAFVFLLMAGMANSVNLTDGLDGLAAGTVMIAMVVMAAIAYRLDQLNTALVAAATCGSCVGFLWFNSHPAMIFMGDTGALAFGGAFAAIAIVTKTEVVSLLVGGIFVIEAISVIIQVSYFKLTHKRVFLMTPIHHHFEQKGWSETTIVIRFWIITALSASIGFAWFFSQST